GLAGRFADRQADLVAAAVADGSPGKAALAALQRGETPNVHGLIEGGARHTAGVIQSVFGSAIGELFLVAVPLALITVLALVFVPNKPLGRQTTGQRLAGGEGSAGDGAPGAGPAGDGAATPDDTPEHDAAAVGVAVGTADTGTAAVAVAARTADTGAASPIVMDTIAPWGEPAGETGSTQV